MSALSAMTVAAPELFLDSVATVRLLTASAAQRDPRLAASLHAAALKTGIVRRNLFVANSLLDAYAKCGRPDSAAKLFDTMRERDVVSWTTLISAYARTGGASGAALSVFLDMLSEEAAPAPNEFTLAALLQACADDSVGAMVHAYLITSGFAEDIFLTNSLIDMYSKLGSIGIDSAEKLVSSTLVCRDVVSWTAVISGCVLNGMTDRALELFARMLEEDGLLPNQVTMLSIIQACSLIREPSLFGWIHAWVMKLDMSCDTLVVNSLVKMYSNNGSVDQGLKVLLFTNGYCCSTVETEVLASLVHGCTLSGSLERGREIHGYLIKQSCFSCSIIQNSLMGMYAKYQEVDSMHRIFTSMAVRDLVAWNTMISCFAKNGHAADALRYLTKIHGMSGGDLVPDSITMLSSIQACSEISSLPQGQILHAYVIRSGFEQDVFVSNAHIDMYAKSGRVDLAEQVFREMNVKDLGSWNSMIGAYGIHGKGTLALKLFEELQGLRKLQPNAVTLSNVLSACAHSGLVEEGYSCFKSMRENHGIEPSNEHYALMVDLLARSGKLSEAEKFIKEMPFSPCSSVWGSLLGACGLYGNVDIAERAARKLSELESDSSIWRVALSNVYASAGRWEDASKVRADIKREGSRKVAGWSTVEVRGGESFRFMAGDSRHPQTKRIYEVCNSIMAHITNSSNEIFYII